MEDQELDPDPHHEKSTIRIASERYHTIFVFFFSLVQTSRSRFYISRFMIQESYFRNYNCIFQVEHKQGVAE